MIEEPMDKKKKLENKVRLELFLSKCRYGIRNLCLTNIILKTPVDFSHYHKYFGFAFLFSQF